MTVLVTGGTGFVGSWVVREILGRGEKAVLYDLFLRTDAIGDIVDRVKIVKGDVLDLGNLVATIQENAIDRIIHTASYLGFESQQRPPLAVRITCEGTANVLEAARLTDVKRVVMTSSQAVYGATPPGEMVHEEYPTRPITVYGATKRLAEWLGLNYTVNYGLDFITVRFPSIYGPTKMGRGWQVPMTDMVENPVMGKPVAISTGGDVKQEWVYVKDMARTVVNACFVKTHEHQIYNLGSGEIYTLLDMADIVKRHIPDAVFDIGKGQDPLYGTGGPLDYTRARQDLDHRITYSIEDGIVEWMEIAKKKTTDSHELTTIPIDIPTLDEGSSNR